MWENVESWLVYGNELFLDYPAIFLKWHNKTKLVPASFSCFLMKKNQVQIQDMSSQSHRLTSFWHKPSRHNDVVTTLLRLRYPTLLWRCHIVAMETSDDVAKTTSLRRFIVRRHNETLQWRRFCNVVWNFNRNDIATSDRRQRVTS